MFPLSIFQYFFTVMYLGQTMLGPNIMAVNRGFLTELAGLVYSLSQVLQIGLALILGSGSQRAQEGLLSSPMDGEISACSKSTYRCRMNPQCMPHVLLHHDALCYIHQQYQYDYDSSSSIIARRNNDLRSDIQHSYNIREHTVAKGCSPCSPRSECLMAIKYIL